MKKRIFNTLKALTACALLAACSPSAPTGRKINVNVPFDFTAANRRLTAGAYEITSDFGQKEVLIRGGEKDSATLALASVAYMGKSQEQARLVFKRYGDRYFLSQVWNAGAAEGRELESSKLEQEAAMNTGKPEIVALVVPAPKPPGQTH